MLHQGDLKLRAPFDELLKINKRGRCAGCIFVTVNDILSRRDSS